MTSTTFVDVVEYPGAEERAADCMAETRIWLDSPLPGASAFMTPPVVRPVSATWTDVEQTMFDASWYAQ